MTTGEQSSPSSTSPPAPRARVALASISAGGPRLEWVRGLLDVQLHPWVDRIIIHAHGPYLDDGRNEMIEKYLTLSDAPYVLITDDDIGFTVEDVTQIVGLALALDVPCVLSGAYRTVRPGQELVVAGWKDEQGRHQMMDLETFHALPPTPLLRIDSAGCGFMLVSRAILLEMRERSAEACLPHLDVSPWFREPIVANEHGVTHFGEDYAFCDRVTALGYPIYLCPGVTLSHVKTVALTF